MDEFGVKSYNFKQEIVSGTTPNLAVRVGGVSPTLDAYSGVNIDFSSANKTNNVDCVYNADSFISPFFYCTANGLCTFFNRFWYQQESTRYPGYITVGEVGIISVGVGSNQAKSQNNGMYHRNQSGNNVLDTQVKNLKLKAQIYIRANTSAVTGTASTKVNGFVWVQSIDLSGLDWEGPNKWFCVAPMMGMHAYWASTIYIDVATIFRFNFTTNILDIGDYYTIQSSAVRQPTYPARDVMYEISCFSETN